MEFQRIGWSMTLLIWMVLVGASLLPTNTMLTGVMDKAITSCKEARIDHVTCFKLISKVRSETEPEGLIALGWFVRDKSKLSAAEKKAWGARVLYEAGVESWAKYSLRRVYNGLGDLVQSSDDLLGR